MISDISRFRTTGFEFENLPGGGSSVFYHPQHRTYWSFSVRVRGAPLRTGLEFCTGRMKKVQSLASRFRAHARGSVRFGLAPFLAGLVGIVPISVTAIGFRAAGIFLLGFPPTFLKFLAGIPKFPCGLLGVFFEISGRPVRFAAGLPGSGIPAIGTIAKIARCECEPKKANKSDKWRAHVRHWIWQMRFHSSPTHVAYRE